jgi:hypothetical protein
VPDFAPAALAGAQFRQEVVGEAFGRDPRLSARSGFFDGSCPDASLSASTGRVSSIMRNASRSSSEIWASDRPPIPWSVSGRTDRP